jgi:tRNA(Leu) C34 or U34 (ribose-2'-O)-methylase TrmL
MTIVGKNARPVGVAPALLLVNPRFAHNVGMCVRLASCFGMQQVWYTGDRVRMEIERRGKLPREERMKGYKEVEIIQYDRPMDQFEGCTPVAVEVNPNSERLQDFVHPKNAVYVFGPEDGSIPSTIMRHCHRFVIIPTRNRYCMNLATATATILWDRAMKLGEIPEEVPGEPVGHQDTDPKALGLYNDAQDTWP